MSEQFYQKFLSLFSGFIRLLTLVLLATMFLLGYLSLQKIGLYYGYCVILIFTGIYGISYYLEFRDFKANLNLFIPSEGPNRELDPLNIEVEDVPLKACLLYRNRANFTDIQKALGLNHPQQAKRELIKGLDILLKSYEKHQGNVKA